MKKIMGYYGARRKRNIDLSRFQKANEPVASLAWEQEELELEEGYEEVEEECEYEDEELSDSQSADKSLDSNQEEQNHFMLDGKPFRLKQHSQKQSFSETHVRTTTYLEKNIHQIIKMLQHQNQIESITKFINDSIKHYLTTRYSE